MLSRHSAICNTYTDHIQVYGWMTSSHHNILNILANELSSCAQTHTCRHTHKHTHTEAFFFTVSAKNSHHPATDLSIIYNGSNKCHHLVQLCSHILLMIISEYAALISPSTWYNIGMSNSLLLPLWPVLRIYWVKLGRTSRTWKYIDSNIVMIVVIYVSLIRCNS